MLKRMLSLFFLPTLLVGLTAMTIAGPAFADDDDERHNGRNGGFYIGLWEGVDPLDGSTVQLSIFPNLQGGGLTVRYREDFFTNCVLENFNTSGRGFIVGDSTVVKRRILKADASRICIKDDETKEVTPLDNFRVRAVRKLDIVIVPQDPDPAVILHRITTPTHVCNPNSFFMLLPGDIAK